MLVSCIVEAQVDPWKKDKTPGAILVFCPGFGEIKKRSAEEEGGRTDAQGRRFEPSETTTASHCALTRVTFTGLPSALATSSGGPCFLLQWSAAERGSWRARGALRDPQDR